MSDLRKQIRDHYAARLLPPARVDAILARGRAAAGGTEATNLLEHPRAEGDWRWLLAFAATLAVLAALGAFFLPLRPGADYAASRAAVTAFFADKPMYSMMSERPDELRAWAIAHGAPPAFQIPARLQSLVGKACTTIEIGGRPAFLLCFMTGDASTAPHGDLVHLLVARREDFRNTPSSSAPVLSTVGDWSFASWVEGDIVYTVARSGSMEALRRFVFAHAARVRAA